MLKYDDIFQYIIFPNVIYSDITLQIKCDYFERMSQDVMYDIMSKITKQTKLRIVYAKEYNEKYEYVKKVLCDDRFSGFLFDFTDGSNKIYVITQKSIVRYLNENIKLRYVVLNVRQRDCNNYSHIFNLIFDNFYKVCYMIDSNGFIEKKYSQFMNFYINSLFEYGCKYTFIDNSHKNFKLNTFLPKSTEVCENGNCSIFSVMIPKILVSCQTDIFSILEIIESFEVEEKMLLIKIFSDYMYCAQLLDNSEKIDMQIN